MASMLFLACTAALPGAAQAPRPRPADPEPISEDLSSAGGMAQANIRERLLLIEINGRDTGAVVTVVEREDEYFMRREDLAHFRIRPPTAPSLLLRGERFVPLAALPGVSLSIDEPRQIARLTVPASLFERSNFDVGEPIVPQLTVGSIGAFLNYDLVAAQTPRGESYGGLFELGASDGESFFGNTFTASRQLDEDRTLRLETYVLHDDPARLSRQRFGDAVTRSGDWGRPTRFGGFQIGTNFGFQPNYIAFPTPTIRGEASLPSTVEVYVDNALRYRSNVDAGPFSIRQVPIITGAGEVKVVVRDMLGVERVITTPFYASPRTLRPGVHDYSYEIGMERENFGFSSFDYGHPFAAGTHRYGLTESLTGELRAEIADDQQTVGSGVVWLVPDIGEFSASTAVSTASDGSGALGKIGYARVGRNWSFVASHQRSTENFVQIGARTQARRIDQLTQASLGWSLGDLGGIGIGLSRLEFGDHTKFDVASLTYGVQINDRAYVNVFAVRTDSDDATTTFGLSLTIPLGPRRTASTQVNSGNGGTTGTVEYRERAPSEGGFGYRLLANRGAIERTEGGASWDSRFGAVAGEVSNAPDGTSGRLLASGGIAFADSRFMATRRIDDSFAVVSIPGFRDVGVLAENRLVGRTDDDGRIVIPNILSYNENRLRLETGDLPIDALIDKDAQTVVPRYRTPIVVTFPVYRANAAIMTAALPNGQPLPPGVRVRIAGRDQDFFTGYDGELFVTGVAEGTVLQASWDNETCVISIGKIHNVAGQAAATLGPVTCVPVETL